MNPQILEVALVTDSGGDATATFSNVRGELRSVFVKAGASGFDAGAVLNVLGSTTAHAYVDNWQCGPSGVINPRVDTALVDGTAAVYAAGGEPVLDRMVVGGEDLVLELESGGSLKDGTVLIVLA